MKPLLRPLVCAAKQAEIFLTSAAAGSTGEDGGRYLSNTHGLRTCAVGGTTVYACSSWKLLGPDNPSWGLTRDSYETSLFSSFTPFFVCLSVCLRLHLRLLSLCNTPSRFFRRLPPLNRSTAHTFLPFPRGFLPSRFRRTGRAWRHKTHHKAGETNSD